MSTQTSVSRLTSIARCGLAYELERVQKLPQTPAGWTIQGIAVHDAADAWEKSGRHMTVADAQEVFRRSWKAEIDEADKSLPDRSKWLVGGRKKVQNDLRDRYSGGLEQVANYITYNLEDEGRLRPYVMPDGSVASEVGFEIEHDGVSIRGYIDLVLQDVRTGELLVRDIKTGSKVPSVPFQLIVYRMALMDVLGEDARWGEFFMTRSAGPTKPIDLTQLDHSRIWGWFHRQASLTEQGLFLPNPGDHCRTCSVAPHCPLMK